MSYNTITKYITEQANHMMAAGHEATEKSVGQNLLWVFSHRFFYT